ncbi:MAG: hypothetical protein AABZ31_13120 [Bdellovibrionota bacterium]
MQSLGMVIVVPFLLAFCSMIYELVLAQYISLYFGGTVFNFTLTIGVFLASMGLGALWSARVARDQIYPVLEKVELGLCGLGLASPLLTSVLGSLSLTSSSPLFTQVLFGLCYGLVVMIGILSGYEIPLLLGLFDNAKKKMTVLSLDYFGSFIAALCYPLLFVPHLGLVQTSLLVSFLNLLVALWIGYRFNKRYVLISAELALIAIVLVLMVQSFWLENWLRGWLYL